MLLIIEIWFFPLSHRPNLYKVHIQFYRFEDTSINDANFGLLVYSPGKLWFSECVELSLGCLLPGNLLKQFFLKLPHYAMLWCLYYVQELCLGIKYRKNPSLKILEYSHFYTQIITSNALTVLLEYVDLNKFDTFSFLLCYKSIFGRQLPTLSIVPTLFLCSCIFYFPFNH